MHYKTHAHHPLFLSVPSPLAPNPPYVRSTSRRLKEHNSASRSVVAPAHDRFLRWQLTSRDFTNLLTHPHGVGLIEHER